MQEQDYLFVRRFLAFAASVLIEACKNSEIDLDMEVMRRSRNCNVDAYKMVQHKVKTIVGRCNLMFKGSNIGQDGRGIAIGHVTDDGRLQEGFECRL
ncbi:hypothetical protein QQ045_005616 [Rhodiola kirilowii]